MDDIYLDRDSDDALTGDIHCSIQQSASHCCSLFSHCCIGILLISGFKLSRSGSRCSVTRDKMSIQMAV